MWNDLDSRPSGGRNLGSLTIALIAANVVIYLIEAMSPGQVRGLIQGWFALSVPGLRSGYVWQLVTFQFLHGGLLHLLLNCWALYVFGQELEEFFGQKRFLQLYLFSGVVGGIIQVLCALLAPNLFGGYLVGASAGVFGLVAVYAALFPDREFTLLVFFIIPVTLRAKTMLLWAVVLAIIGAVLPTSNVAHAAHLGGILGGLLYLNWARPNPD